MFPFTSNIGLVHSTLATLVADGGGDGPEAVTAALDQLSQLAWRANAAKVAILITDAPPHGIEPNGCDHFPDGDPTGKDPLQLARTLASNGVVVYMVACEPTLSQYERSVDFYRGLVKVTGGLLVPMTSATLLADTIVATVTEAVDLERLHAQLNQRFATEFERLRQLDSPDPVAVPYSDVPSAQVLQQVSDLVYNDLLASQVQTTQVHFDNLYKETPGTCCFEIYHLPELSTLTDFLIGHVNPLRIGNEHCDLGLFRYCIRSQIVPGSHQGPTQGSNPISRTDACNSRVVDARFGIRSCSACYPDPE